MLPQTPTPAPQPQHSTLNTQHSPQQHSTTPSPQHSALEGLTPKQSLALTALLQGSTQARAAAHAGCSERSIRGWLRDPAFAEALQEARAGLWLETTLRAEETARLALTSIQQMIREADTPTARLRAAKLALDFSLKLLRAEPLVLAQGNSCSCFYSCSESTPSPPQEPAKSGQNRPSVRQALGTAVPRPPSSLILPPSSSTESPSSPIVPPSPSRGDFDHHPATGQNRPEAATNADPALGAQAPGPLPSAHCARTGKKRQKPAAPRRGRRT